MRSGGTGVIASSAAHLAFVVLCLASFASTNPLNAPASAPIAVDIVSPAEFAEASTPEPTKEEAFTPDLVSKDGSADLMLPRDVSAKDTSSDTRVKNEPPKDKPLQDDARQARASDTLPARKTAVPTITERPGVVAPLFLPEYLPELQESGSAPLADTTAQVSQESITGLRARVKQCWRAPLIGAAAQDVKITVRLYLRRDGKLQAEPEMMAISGASSENGAVIMRSVIDAVARCEPYNMLPADKYDEWKMLDVSLTPRELAGG